MLDFAGGEFLFFDPDANLHGGIANIVEACLEMKKVTNGDMVMKGELVKTSGNHLHMGVAAGNNGTGLINIFSNNAAMDKTHGVTIFGEHD